MDIVVKNLFADIPESSGQEDFLSLVKTEGVRVERIVSNGQGSPEGFWYDQAESEWVLLVQGRAVLRFEDGKVVLKAGDYLLIRARVKHRVEETSEDAVWLAVHYS